MMQMRATFTKFEKQILILGIFRDIMIISLASKVWASEESGTKQRSG